MSLQCPNCNSLQTASLRAAQKAGALVGTISGVARGASMALAGSQAGIAVVTLTSPPSIPLATLSNAILGGLAGGVGGCALGAQLGEQLDRHVLANNLCLTCGHRFNLPA